MKRSEKTGEMFFRRPVINDDSAVEVPTACGDSDDPTSGDTYYPGIYRLSSRKMFRYSQRLERRARKDQATDRRTQPRFSEDGTQLQDRRLENRMANVRKLRKTG